MTRGLCDRLGGQRSLAVKLTLLKEDVEKESADAREELNDRGKHAGDKWHAAPLDARLCARWNELHQKRHQAEQKVNKSFAGNKLDQPHGNESHCPTKAIEPKDSPAHKAPPLQRPPTVREELNDGEQD